LFLGLTGAAVPIATHAAGAVVVTPALQAACASTEFTAALAQGESLPRVGGTCDLTGKMVVAGNLGVPVPDSDKASNSTFVTYTADTVVTADDHHSLRVDADRAETSGDVACLSRGRGTPSLAGPRGGQPARKMSCWISRR
jgi:hypothetical protein